jgi:hypothetical protein
MAGFVHVICKAYQDDVIVFGGVVVASSTTSWSVSRVQLVRKPREVCCRRDKCSHVVNEAGVRLDGLASLACPVDSKVLYTLYVTKRETETDRQKMEFRL